MLFLILLLLAAVCFIASVVTGYRTTTTNNGTANRYNLVALGLFFWVLVPLIQQIRAT